MKARKKRTTAGDKTICLPMLDGVDYEHLVSDTADYRVYLDQMIAKYPE
jgi:protein-tyrosine phosphatase